MTSPKPVRCPNRAARVLVQQRREFIGNHLYARWEACDTPDPEDVYVVYSYGRHFPLFVYHDATGTWFENSDRYSVTTSKHRSQTHPLVPTTALPVETLRQIVTYGLVTGVARAAGIRMAG